MKKSKRQQQIIKLIKRYKIATQEELNRKLEDSGVFVNQSSISRDCTSLGLVKVDGFYEIPLIEGEKGAFGEIAIETAGDILIVVKCGIGMASGVALIIDQANIAEIVGTIAGDDTIFVAVKNAKSQILAIKGIWSAIRKI